MYHASTAAYLGLIWPKLEYASTVWDPYLLKDITAVERIQRIAARWVKSNYYWENNVSKCLVNYNDQHYVSIDQSQD